MRAHVLGDHFEGKESLVRDLICLRLLQIDPYVYGLWTPIKSTLYTTKVVVVVVWGNNQPQLWINLIHTCLVQILVVVVDVEANFSQLESIIRF